MFKSKSTRIAVILAIIMFVTTFAFTANVASAQGPTPTKSVGSNNVNQDCFDLKSPSGPRTKPGGKDSAGNTCVAGLLWTDPQGRSLNVPYNGYALSASSTTTGTITPGVSLTNTAPSDNLAAPTGSTRPKYNVCTFNEDGTKYTVEPDAAPAVVHAPNGTIVTLACTWDDSRGAVPDRSEKTALEVQIETWRSVLWTGITMILSVVFAIGALVAAGFIAVAMVHGDLFRSVRDLFTHTPNWILGPMVFIGVMSAILAFAHAPSFGYILVWGFGIIGGIASALHAHPFGGGGGGAPGGGEHAAKENH